ncbi:hypothetical protein CRG98_039233 [Punica granatum]|uniref:Uncharacterized protein n=1 Tax=Punica granatum TaxID=22663 RepID=A0A2I0I8R7_PUNGR|nr:hypothetical protein CRG98_039233 [Punica granatum]
MPQRSTVAHLKAKVKIPVPYSDVVWEGTVGHTPAPLCCARPDWPAGSGIILASQSPSRTWPSSSRIFPSLPVVFTSAIEETEAK